MKTSAKYFLTIGNKKYFYTLKQVNSEETHVVCEAANIAQDFLNEDIPELLHDLPNLIISEKDYKNNQEEVIRFRISADDKKLIEKKAHKKGYASVSGYLRDLALKN
ncbi:MAG: hypothetical protein WC101_04495 [Candidatus Gracilibacteria bacterium]